MKYYQGEYHFNCRNTEYEYIGNSQFSFTHDEETDEITSMDIQLWGIKAYNRMKEETVTTIRLYMVVDIKALIKEDLIQDAIEGGLC